MLLPALTPFDRLVLATQPYLFVPRLSYRSVDLIGAGVAAVAGFQLGEDDTLRPHWNTGPLLGGHDGANYGGNGSRTEYWSFPWDPILGSADRTVMLISRNSSTGSDQRLFTYGTDTGTGLKFHIRLDATTNGGRYRFEVQGGYKVFDLELDNSDCWLTFLVLDGASNVTDAKLYAGRLHQWNRRTTDTNVSTIGVHAQSAQGINTTAGSLGDLVLGRALTASAQEQYDGKLGPVAVWDRALPGREMSRIYAEARRVSLMRHRAPSRRMAA